MNPPQPLPSRLPRVKFHPPAAPAAQVIRQAVADRLRAAATARVVIVRAAAGFGKTTVMLQHRARLEAAGVATAWLTLDSADNDPARLIAGVDMALQAIVGQGEGLRADEQPVPRTVGELALQVTDSLAQHPEPFAFFLDDFEALQEPAAIAWVRQLIDHLPHQPGGGQLVIGSRNAPDLKLGRLHARGQMLEVDAEALRFSEAETGQFFHAARAVPLAVDEVRRLHRKTEGWPAALWLASAALERGASPADFVAQFSGSSRAVADYLADDVLARQSEPVRRFLLHTSILRYLSPSLCAALLPGADCEAMLQQLEAASLIAPMESEGCTWRYHSLIAGFMKAQLEREAPEELPRLHLAAARWYLAQARPVPAIDHAIAGGHTALVLQWLAEHAPPLLAQGRMRLLTRWFDALPDGALHGHLPLQAIRIWALNFTRGPWEAMERLRESGLRDADDPAVRAHVQALEPSLLAMMDRLDEAFEAGQAALARWPTGEVFADMVLANAMANVLAVMGRRGEARRLLETARSAQGEQGSMFNRMYSETVEAIVDLQEGRLREATARLRIALGSDSGSYSYTGGNAWAGVMYAAVVYEANDLKQAAQLLQVYVPLARDVLLADHVTLGCAMLSRIAFARGDVDEAFELLTRLEYLGHERRLERMVAGAKLERARLLLLQGRAHAARDEMARAADAGLWARVGRLRLIGNDLDYLELAQLRWEALAGDALAAVARLNVAADLAEGEGRLRRAMKLRFLCALAHQRAGAPAAALATLGPVLKAACAEGYARLLLDEGGTHVGPLLQRFWRTLEVGGGAQRDPVLADYVLRLVQACGPFEEPADAQAEPLPQLLEPLTPKEISVLQLLAEGYSNGAIAEKLLISDSTVRTHLRSINHKICAESRTQAVAMARRLGVIS
ncbi:MAG: LuxR C-terminal-related transcriptional regulator [Acidovorax sp.]